MINDGLHNRIHNEIKEKTLEDLKNFKSFLYSSFKEYNHYEKSNQPGQLYLTLKTHKPKNIERVTLENLKFDLVITQSDTCNWGASETFMKLAM